MTTITYPACGHTADIISPRRAALEQRHADAGHTCAACTPDRPSVKNPYAVAIGSITSDKKREQARLNLEMARGAGPVCTCGQEKHKYTCARYNAERVARYRARKAQEKPE